MGPQRETVRERAMALGFSEVRFTTVDDRAPHAAALESWLAAGHHGDMGYMERQAPTRLDPRVRMSEARTAVVLAWPHHTRPPPDPGGLTGRVARYAWGRDYHNLVGKRLRKLVKSLRADGLRAWGGLDTAPILERSWAAAAGLGYPGKNACQIVPSIGSYFFIAVVFLDVELAPDAARGDHCGRCTRCLPACPTDAFVAPHELDARRCISYWTIEARGLAPRALRPSFGRWLFGCDVCQEVCPHNGEQAPAAHPDLAPRRAWVDLLGLLATSDADLRERIRGTPLSRPGPTGLKRNALVVLANLGDDLAVDGCRSQLTHPEPVVRAAAVWALQQLGDERVAGHTDESEVVQAELHAAGTT